MSHALIAHPLPLPLVPLPPSAPPMLLPQLLAQLPPELATQQVPDLQTLLAHAEPGTHKLVLDLYMRQNFPVLWRSAVETARQTKAEFCRPAPANEPRMVSKERIVHEQPFVSHEDLKRAATSEHRDLAWRPVYTKIDTGRYQDPASIQVFFNELSGLKCTEHSCSSKPNVHLDYTGPRPNDAIEPFSYPILVDKELRILEPEAFQATGNRLHACSFLQPYPFTYSQPPREREAVNVMASAKECEHITPFKPASCKALSDDDQIAQIDRFFAENRNNSKPGGVVFVDGHVIERWGKESKLLRDSGMTALAIRPEKTIYSFIGGMAGVMVLTILAFPVYYGRNKLKHCPGGSARLLRAGWERIKSAAGALWRVNPRTPAEPPVEPATNPQQKNADSDALESSVVIEESDSSDSDSTHAGDFSSSSASQSIDQPSGPSESSAGAIHVIAHSTERN